MVLRGGWGEGGVYSPEIGMAFDRVFDRSSDKEIDKGIDKSFGRSSDKKPGIHICIIEQSYLFYWSRRHDEYDPTIVCIRMIWKSQ